MVIVKRQTSNKRVKQSSKKSALSYHGHIESTIICVILISLYEMSVKKQLQNTAMIVR